MPRHLNKCWPEPSGAWPFGPTLVGIKGGAEDVQPSGGGERTTYAAVGWRHHNAMVKD